MTATLNQRNPAPLADTVAKNCDPAEKHRVPWASWCWQAIRLLAASALSYWVAAAVGLQEGYWALITVAVVTQPLLNDTIAASRTRIVGTLVGAAAGLVVLEAVQHGLPRLPLFWAAMVPLAMLTAIHQSLRLSCITLIVVVLIPSAGPPFARPLERVYGILLGAAACIAVAAIRYAGKPRAPAAERVAGGDENSAMPS